MKDGDNIIKTSDSTIIMNGGNPLNGCPTDWDEAKLIQDKLNEDRPDYSPKWSFDCGFKLDYDGGIFSISSRFYPPKTHYGPTWDGTVTVYCMEEELEQHTFDCNTLGELKIEVDKYVAELKQRILTSFKQS